MEVLKLNQSYIEEIENNITEENCLLISNILDNIENEMSYGLLDNKNNLVGVIDFGYYDDGDINDAIINNIVIFDNNQGKGYGKMLLCSSFKKEFGVEFKGRLYADALHNGVRGFYEKLGFYNIENYMYVKEFK